MMAVLNCIVFGHNIALVALAGIMCVAGVIVTFSLYWRTIAADHPQRLGWLFLTSLSAGASIWSTHFIAMLGYQPAVPVAFDPVMTIGSLIIAIFGSAFGMTISAYRVSSRPAMLGGALVGLAISGMHFMGMFAYRVVGLINWNEAYILSAIGMAVVLSAVALRLADGAQSKLRRALAMGCFTLGIVSLHFTAMTALTVTPMADTVPAIDSAAFEAMALSIALIALLVIGASLSSYLIDSNSRILSDEHIHYLAIHDPLTGLPNRASFNDRIDEEIRVASKTGQHFAVIGIDLNGFKEINDTWGHAAGDRTLQQFAKKLKRAQGEGAYVARMGGDEFAVLLPYATEADLTRALEHIEHQLSAQPSNEDLPQSVSASMGIALFPKDGETREALINNADLAMYRSKSDPMRRAQYYDPAMGEAIRWRRMLADELRIAIAKKDLRPRLSAVKSLAMRRCADGNIRSEGSFHRVNSFRSPKKPA
jgi:diguanylate cyclase (GGDEF)-like protein